MKKTCRKKSSQSGSSMLETLIALIMLCLLFFGAMQIFQWAFARMFCDYSSFYAAKAFSLGYAYRTISKAARVAAIPISGPDKYGLLKLPRKELTNRLRLYMSTGNAGVNFDYWDGSGKDPDLRVSYSEYPELKQIRTKVTLHNAPYISKGFNNFLHITNKPVNPYGSTYMVNHCAGWTE
ncbi:MAG: pilus assembly protein [Lentisphaeria bacterium]|nr:pilus assembly protein [Lentisphaeria bacterium]